jgi:catechol 2,3-dioxygenase-like lactoylglutathione lyase family enzyme
MEIKFQHSIALVKDIAVSKHFYQDIIGLTVEADYDNIIIFQNNFAIHKADVFYEYINKPYHGEKMGHNNVDFYFTTNDLDGFEQKLKESDVSFIHKIRQHEWGEKVIRIYDPDGHIIEIGDAYNQ